MCSTETVHEYIVTIRNVAKKPVERWVLKKDIPKMMDVLPEGHRVRRRFKIKRIMKVDLSINNACMDLNQKKSGPVNDDRIKSLSNKSVSIKSDKSKASVIKGGTRKRKASVVPKHDFSCQVGESIENGSETAPPDIAENSGDKSSPTNSSTSTLVPYTSMSNAGRFSLANSVAASANVNIHFAPTFNFYHSSNVTYAPPHNNSNPSNMNNMRFRHNYTNSRRDVRGMRVESFENGRIMRTRGCDSWKPSKDLL